MPNHAVLSTFLGLAVAASGVAGQYSNLAPRAVVPLVNRHYTYPGGVPYKVDTDTTGRGPQSGYTQCNSTTEGPNSLCQLSLLNSIQDFCLWGSDKPNSVVADIEAETVAYCSQPGHGTRVMPAGTLTGVQVLKAPAYTLFSGTINQVGVGLTSDDYGGELDPHGADLRGNPLGGLVYTAGGFTGGNNSSYTQVIEWHNFMGSNIFCFKICNPNVANSATYCNNIFDRTGCQFVAPASYAQNVFEVCDSDNQDPVGVYTGSDGKTTTYKQPGEATPIDTLPAVKTPKSSNCQTFTSSVLYAAGASVSGAAPVSGSAAPSSAASSGASSGINTQTTARPTSGSATPSSTPTTSSAAGRAASLMGAGTLGGFTVLAGTFLAGFIGVIAAL